jgi:hypothetical protein
VNNAELDASQAYRSRFVVELPKVDTGSISSRPAPWCGHGALVAPKTRYLSEQARFWRRKRGIQGSLVFK